MSDPNIGALLDFIVRRLVDEPDEVHINEVSGRRLTVYEITVAERDRGKVIGKQGRIANALRTVAKAAALRIDTQVAVEIIT